jgi:hypothetical protein
MAASTTAFLGGQQVVSLAPNSPAAAAGAWAVEDDVITHAGSVFVGSEAAALGKVLRENLGKPVELKVFRKSTQQERSMQVTPALDWGGAGCLGLNVVLCGPLPAGGSAAAASSSSAAAAAAGSAGAPAAGAMQRSGPAFDALCASLNGTWIIDERPGQSQTTEALMKYAGVPWLMIRAVIAAPTPPMEFQLSAESVSIVFPGMFTLKNKYQFDSSQNMHKAPMGPPMPATVTLEEGGVLLLVVRQGEMGDLYNKYFLDAAGRFRVEMYVVKAGEQKVHIKRVYDRAKK